MVRPPIVWALFALSLMSCKDGPPRSAGSPAPVDSDVLAAYRADLQFIAKPRPSGSAHWRATQDHCAKTLSDAGFTVERQAYDGGINVLGRRTGTKSPNELVLIGAHYDSVPDCPGADDNASGVAGVLHVARALGQREFDRTLVLVCWDEEEIGFLGSSAFVKSFPTSQRIVAHYNFEMIAFASSAPNSQQLPVGFEQLFPTQIAALEKNELRADFIAVIADPSSALAAQRFAAHAARLLLPYQVLEIPDALKSSALLADLRRSDHAPFWDADLPGIMLTDTADFRNANYHCASGTDSVATLNFDFALKVIEATVAAASDMLMH